MKKFKKMNFICEICEKSFSSKHSLRRHVRTQHEFSCSSCRLTFTNKADFVMHQLNVRHENQSKIDDDIYCPKCKLVVRKSMWKGHIRSNVHKEKSIIWDDNGMKVVESSYKNRIVTYVIDNDNKDNLIPEKFLNAKKEKVLKVLRDNIVKHGSIKYNYSLLCKYQLRKIDFEVEEMCIAHQTKMQIVTQTMLDVESLDKFYNENLNTIIAKMEEFQERGSGWTLTEIIHLELNVNKYECIKGNSYIKLSNFLLLKRACLNVMNSDEYCFKWAVISALKKGVNHPERCISYNIKEISAEVIDLGNGIVLNFKNLQFPMAVNEVKKFDQQNPDISVNVFGIENDKIVGPYHLTLQEKSNHINLLVLSDDLNNNFHYVWIKNMSR